MDKKATNLLNLLMAQKPEIWRECKDFPEYEVSSEFRLRRKSDGKRIRTFFWQIKGQFYNREEHYALRDRTGRFRFVPFYEPFEDVKFIEDKPWYSVGPFTTGQKGSN